MSKLPVCIYPFLIALALISSCQSTSQQNINEAIALSDTEIREELIGVSLTGEFIRSTGERVTLNLLLTEDGRWTGDDVFNPPKQNHIKTEKFEGKYQIADGKICKQDKVTHRNGKPFDGPISKRSCFPISRSADVFYFRDIKVRRVN